MPGHLFFLGVGLSRRHWTNSNQTVQGIVKLSDDVPGLEEEVIAVLKNLAVSNQEQPAPNKRVQPDRATPGRRRAKTLSTRCDFSPFPS